MTMTIAKPGKAHGKNSELPVSHAGANVNQHVHNFVNEAIKLCRPDRIYWCNGSEHERKKLLSDSVAEGVLIPLNPEKRPGCYLHRSNPNDVARSEHCTFICTPGQDMAGP